jgi:integrase
MSHRQNALEQAFDAWLAHQRVAGRLRRGSSEAVYRAMWQALVAWCGAQRPPLRLADVRGTRLQAYLASRQGQQLADGVLTLRYQQRLASLVARVQAHQAWQQQQDTATAAHALALAVTIPQRHRSAPLVTSGHGGTDEPPRHLLPAQTQVLIDWLTRPLLAPAAPGPAASTGRWQTWRDRCAAALQLGAGLGPGDVRALRLVDLRPVSAPSAPSGRPAQPRWQLHVAANGSAPAHTAPLADWAGVVLQGWLARWHAEALGGPWLLPSTRSGKPWGKVAQYEAARRVLADAGLDPDGGGSFRLRHTFALRQLQQGHDAGTVAGWLGVTDPQVMLRYQRALPPRVAAVPATVEEAFADPSTDPPAAAHGVPAAAPWPV